MIKKSIPLILSLFLLSCFDSNTEIDCAAVLCAATENTIYVQFLDATSEENLLDLGTIQSESIEIRDKDNQVVTFSVEMTSSLGQVLRFPVSTEAYGLKSYTLQFEGGDPFTIDFNSTFKEGECCGPYTAIDGVNVSTYTNEFTPYGILPLQVTVYID